MPLQLYLEAYFHHIYLDLSCFVNYDNYLYLSIFSCYPEASWFEQHLKSILVYSKIRAEFLSFKFFMLLHSVNLLGEE